MMLLAPARGKAVSSCSPAMYDALLAVRVAMRSRAGPPLGSPRCRLPWSLPRS